MVYGASFSQLFLKVLFQIKQHIQRVHLLLLITLQLANLLPKLFKAA